MAKFGSGKNLIVPSVSLWHFSVVWSRHGYFGSTLNQCRIGGYWLIQIVIDEFTPKTNAIRTKKSKRDANNKEKTLLNGNKKLVFTVVG